jgi:glucokinase
LGHWCEQSLGVTPTIGNDCNVAALAEARLGAGEGVDRVFFVTVGTGVGGGFVVRGQIDGVNRPAVAEIGHLRPGTLAVNPHETVESYASGLGIETRTRHLLQEATSSAAAHEDLLQRCHGNLQTLTAKAVCEAALQGNAFAEKVFDRAIQTLGWGIAQVITLISPHRVVVGGGVALIGEVFFHRLRTATGHYVFPPLANSYEIVPAALGELSVVHGAIQLAKRCS